MKDSNDISNLYKMLGESPENYREIVRESDLERSNDRWPILSLIQDMDFQIPSVHTAVSVQPALTVQPDSVAKDEISRSVPSTEGVILQEAQRPTVSPEIAAEPVVMDTAAEIVMMEIAAEPVAVEIAFESIARKTVSDEGVMTSVAQAVAIEIHAVVDTSETFTEVVSTESPAVAASDLILAEMASIEVAVQPIAIAVLVDDVPNTIPVTKTIPVVRTAAKKVSSPVVSLSNIRMKPGSAPKPLHALFNRLANEPAAVNAETIKNKSVLFERLIRS